MLRMPYSLDDGLFDVRTEDELFAAVRELFLDGRIAVPVIIEKEGRQVVAVIDDPHDIDANEDMNVVLGFCKARRFGKAKKVLKELLAKKPYLSDAYRLQAQIEMTEKETDRALLEASGLPFAAEYEQAKAMAEKGL